MNERKPIIYVSVIKLLEDIQTGKIDPNSLSSSAYYLIAFCMPGGENDLLDSRESGLENRSIKESFAVARREKRIAYVFEKDGQESQSAYNVVKQIFPKTREINTDGQGLWKSLEMYLLNQGKVIK